MKTSQAGLDLIKEFEGFEAEPYICAGGKNTIGYGHVIKKGEAFDTITEETATALLADDVEDAEGAVNDYVHVELTQNQFDALVSFVFNIGGIAFYRSTLLKKLNKGDYEGAAKQFTRWVYAGGRKLNGLIKRRQAEMELFNDK